MKTVAYIGNFEPQWSTENDVRKAFEHIGWSVIAVQENQPHQVLSLADRIANGGIDLLLITSTWDNEIPMDLWLTMLHLCAVHGIPTATYHLDVFWGSDRGDRRWWLNPMFRTGHVFTASGDWDKQWTDMGVNHHWLRPAVRHDAAHFGTPRAEYECDVAFVGSNGIGYHESVWPYRRRLVDELRAMCQRNGWTWRNPGGELDKPNAGKVERGEDRNDFYASAKVTVGDSLCLKRDDSLYCSDRAYEAPGCGGFLIMPHLQFLRDDYGDELPMYKWGDFEHLESKIKYYLENSESREYTRKATQAIVARDHTYVNRVKTIIETVGLNV